MIDRGDVCLLAETASAPSISRRLALVLATALVPLSGCASSFMSSAGPSAGGVARSATQSIANAGIIIIDLDEQVARQVIQAGKAPSLALTLGEVPPVGSLVDSGDVLDIAIWEAPPAALFGSAVGGMAEALMAGNQTARNTALPEQMVDSSGKISVPFVGQVVAAGRTTQQIEREIAAKLQGKAHQPQVVVRLVRNPTKDVTVVGDVASSRRIPLTARGERVLDALASAGGVKQPVNKTMIQITRGGVVVAAPLESIITDPRQNVRLQANDVVTAYFQPFSFTALGATNANAEVPFEGTGITLSQALGRIGGLNDQRADASGVFIFRFEDPAALPAELAETARKTPEGKVPVIYRVNLRNAAIFFAAQEFPVRNKDIIYTSNASMAEFQKFVNIVSSIVVPVVTIKNATGL